MKKTCSQCGRAWRLRACGPTHAVIYHEMRHPKPARKGDEMSKDTPGLKNRVCSYRCRVIGPHVDHFCVSDADVEASRRIAFAGTVDELADMLDGEDARLPPRLKPRGKTR